MPTAYNLPRFAYFGIKNIIISLSSRLVQVKVLQFIRLSICRLHLSWTELAWRSRSVMDCLVTAWGSIPGGNGVTAELHVLRKGQ